MKKIIFDEGDLIYKDFSSRKKLNRRSKTIKFKKGQILRNTTGSIMLVGDPVFRKKIATTVDFSLGKLRKEVYRQPRRLISAISNKLRSIKVPSNNVIRKLGMVYSNIRAAKLGGRVSSKELDEFDKLVDGIASEVEKKKEKHFELPDTQFVTTDTPEYFDLGRGSRQARKMSYNDNEMNWGEYD